MSCLPLRKIRTPRLLRVDPTCFLCPIALEDDDGTVMATCPDLPELATFGDDRDEALARAADALGEAIAARIHAGRDIFGVDEYRTRMLPESRIMAADRSRSAQQPPCPAADSLSEPTAQEQARRSAESSRTLIPSRVSEIG